DAHREGDRERGDDEERDADLDGETSAVPRRRVAGRELDPPRPRLDELLTQSVFLAAELPRLELQGAHHPFHAGERYHDDLSCMNRASANPRKRREGSGGSGPPESTTVHRV